MADEKKLWMSVRRGQHVRSCRKLGLFEHHGVVIAESDLKHIEPSLWPETVEPFLVAEQNTSGLRIVTLEKFCTDHFFKTTIYKLNIVQYSADARKVIIHYRHMTSVQKCAELPKTFGVFGNREILLFVSGASRTTWCLSSECLFIRR